MPLIWGKAQYLRLRQIGATGKSRIARMRILPVVQIQPGGLIASASEAIHSPPSVMAGLVPAIHVLFRGRKQDVDHRDKRGDDGFYPGTDWIASSPSLLAMTAFSERATPPWLALARLPSPHFVGEG